MAALSTQTITRAGITPSFAGVAASDTFTPSLDTFIEVKNTSGTPDTCVVQVLAGDPPGLTIADVSVSVPATTGDKMIGPFPPNFFADPTTGVGTITHTQTTSVTIGVFACPGP